MFSTSVLSGREAGIKTEILVILGDARTSLVTAQVFFDRDEISTS